ncbi:MAG: cytochrome c [Chromatiaceae bacterium]|nr:cytochrome c [Chromatiaceae bacterium]MCP5407986.1 cytochrome c [Chromatiaceae bacterium]MCP5442885.1 cytochrome c [Chromatiaceae bacterium]
MVKEEQAPAAQPEPTPAAVAQPANDGAGLFVAKACSSCHGADANSPIMPIYPRLAGQNAQYLAQQMKDIKSGARNHGQTMLMKGIMAGVSEDEIKTIADWLSTL